MKTCLIETIDSAVLTLTINRPESLNALNHDLIEALRLRLQQAEKDQTVRCIVITGGTGKAFIAGADIQELSQFKPLQAEAFAEKGQALMDSIARSSKPVIAAINGYALGGGCELAMACHLRIAHEKAIFGQPEINLGLIPGFGGTQRLARLCGRAAALELCLMGQNIDAQRAYELGLVQSVCTDETFPATVNKMTKKLSNAAPNALSRILQTIDQGLGMPLEQSMVLERQQFSLCFAHSNAQEGTQAFLDKRKPQFTD